MLKSQVLMFSAISFWIFCTSSYSEESATISIVPGLYSVKTEIVMPHLGESLRYATTEAQQCFDQEAVFGLFPILSEPTFVGCKFVRKKNDSTRDEFNLVCSNPTAATGMARFHIGEATFRATLDVKMGGKNMKFSQRISGYLVGACN